MKKFTALLLCIILLFGFSFSANATATPEFLSYMETQEYAAGIAVYVGSDETERNIRWYSADTDTVPVVLLDTDDDLSDGQKFTGEYIVNYQGDHSNIVKITGLEYNTTYYYECVTESYTSPVYSFSTSSDTAFTALYLTDIHIDNDEEENPDDLSKTSYRLALEIEAAAQNGKIDLLLSAGDQATEGLREQYEGFAASPLIKTFSMATTVGNHDRKGIDYKYFNAVPNEQNMIVGSFICNDYFFKKGDVLFCVFDSNNGSGIDHERAIKNALKAYPDCKWRVAMFHHDLYGERIESREDENKLLRLLWYPLMDEYSFDLVLLGHSHYYTVSNVLYDNETVETIENNSTITNATGTVYMVSGSTNHVRTITDEEPPLGEEIEVENAVITPEAIYNLIDFTEDSITVKSYTMESGECFHSFTLEKTSADGGHIKDDFFTSAWKGIRNSFVRVVGTIYAFFNNISVLEKLEDYGIEGVKFFDAIMN